MGKGVCKRNQESSSGEASHLCLVLIVQEMVMESSAVCGGAVRQTLDPEGFKTKNTAIWEEGYLNPMCTH